MIQIPHSRPAFGADYEQALVQTLRSKSLAQGDVTRLLEGDIQQQLNKPYVLATDSGTSALMLAIRSLADNKKNIKVGIPAYACASLLFAVKAAGAVPVFMDCNSNLGLDAEQAMKTAESLDVLILVHPFGMVEPLVSASFPCPVIEDVAQSVGSTFKGQLVGTFTDICIGSFYATKPWGGAYGGFIATNQQDLVQTCKTMSDPDLASLQTPYAGHHQLSNIHATLALKRLEHAEDEREKRKHWAQQYDVFLTQTDAISIQTPDSTMANHFRYIVRCQQEAKVVIANFRAMGIAASHPVQQPLHLSNEESFCPQADNAWKHCVSLPLLSDMTDPEFEYMQKGIQTCFTS